MENRVFKIRCSQIGQIMSNAKKQGELSQTCKSFLHKWYANDFEEIHSKYIDKGNLTENEVLEMAADVLGFGIIDKNELHLEDEYFTGTCDALTNDYVIDVKSVWNKETLDKRASDGFDEDYALQLTGYMHLYKKQKAILFYGLVNTPEEVNYGNEIVFDFPLEQRWIAFEFQYNQTTIDAIIERVKMCREYLDQYDEKIKNNLGKLIK